MILNYNIQLIMYVLVGILSINNSDCHIAPGKYVGDIEQVDKVWNFKTLNEITDGSQNMNGKINYLLLGDTLKIYTRPNTYDRPKVRSKENDHTCGEYSWRVFVPQMGKGDMASIGCFLYKDDLHELDFEIGYGKEKIRKSVGTSDSEVLCYITSQGNPWHQKIKPIKVREWYDFKIVLSIKNGNYYAQWYINDKLFSSRQLEYGNETNFFVFASVENLKFIGNHIAKQENYALFDYMMYRSEPGQ
ncbi:hypothetical protein [Mariniphaga sediminis]|uniref:hypothetical protein n=1 Tax=Mariniphaga sediminis TaxID=1628158 RepID=UPI003563006C